MKALLVLATVFATAICCSAATITVDWDGSGDYTTIQAGINAAVSGADTVIVADGTYTGVGNYNIDFLGKAITVKSENGPENCIIDCQNVDDRRGFYFHNGEGANTVLDGFTVKRGNIIGNPGKGGGIYCVGASPTIKNCIITNNRTFGSDGTSGSRHGKNACGGGVYCTSNSDLLIINCTISSNTAQGGSGLDSISSSYTGSGGTASGGGIFCELSSNLTMEHCQIANNTAQGGGGGQASIVRGGNGGQGWGAGLFCSSDSTIDFYNSAVQGNHAMGGEAGLGADGGDGGEAKGGGIYHSGIGASIVQDCYIKSNTVTGGDGGYSPISLPGYGHGGSGGDAYGGSTYFSSDSYITITNCLIDGNHADGGNGSHGHNGGGDGGNTFGGGACAATGSYLVIANSTIVDNTSSHGSNGIGLAGPDGEPGVAQGGGIYCSSSSPTLIDDIFWGNSDDGGTDESAQIHGGSPSVSYSCILGLDTFAGNGNIGDNPLFVTGISGDYYLSQIAAGQAGDSPCVDAGSDAAVILDMDKYTTRTDKRGDGGVVDMGHHYLENIADLNEDGYVNMDDVLIMGLQWLDTPGIPSADIAPEPRDIFVDYQDFGVIQQNWQWP